MRLYCCRISKISNEVGKIDNFRPLTRKEKIIISPKHSLSFSCGFVCHIIVYVYCFKLLITYLGWLDQFHISVFKALIFQATIFFTSMRFKRRKMARKKYRHSCLSNSQPPGHKSDTLTTSLLGGRFVRTTFVIKRLFVIKFQSRHIPPI